MGGISRLGRRRGRRGVGGGLGAVGGPLTVARPTDSPPPAPPLHRVASRDDHTTLSDSSRTSAHPREPRTSRAAFARTSPGAPRPRPRLRARASARHQCFLAAGGHGTCSPSVRAAPRAAPRASRRVLRLTERAGSTDLGPTDGEEGCQAQCHGAQSRNPRVASFQTDQPVALCLTAAPRTAASKRRSPHQLWNHYLPRSLCRV